MQTPPSNGSVWEGDEVMCQRLKEGDLTWAENQETHPWGPVGEAKIERRDRKELDFSERKEESRLGNKASVRAQMRPGRLGAKS